MNQGLRPRLVAAVRWDYEVGLLSRAEVVHKYRLVIAKSTAYQIMAGTLYPDVAPVRHSRAWAKLSWRQAA